MSDADKGERIRRVLDECLRRRAAGQVIPDAEVIAQHPELMPELQDVGPWHSVGQRRSLNEYGRAAELGLALVQSNDSSDGDL